MSSVDSRNERPRKRPTRWSKDERAEEGHSGKEKTDGLPELNEEEYDEQWEHEWEDIDDLEAKHAHQSQKPYYHFNRGARGTRGRGRGRGQGPMRRGQGTYNKFSYSGRQHTDHSPSYSSKPRREALYDTEEDEHMDMPPGVEMTNLKVKIQDGKRFAEPDESSDVGFTDGKRGHSSFRGRYARGSRGYQHSSGRGSRGMWNSRATTRPSFSNEDDVVDCREVLNRRKRFHSDTAECDLREKLQRRDTDCGDLRDILDGKDTSMLDLRDIIEPPPDFTLIDEYRAEESPNYAENEESELRNRSVTPDRAAFDDDMGNYGDDRHNNIVTGSRFERSSVELDRRSEDKWHHRFSEERESRRSEIMQHRDQVDRRDRQPFQQRIGYQRDSRQGDRASPDEPRDELWRSGSPEQWKNRRWSQDNEWNVNEGHDGRGGDRDHAGRRGSSDDNDREYELVRERAAKFGREMFGDLRRGKERSPSSERLEILERGRILHMDVEMDRMPRQWSRERSQSMDSKTNRSFRGRSLSLERDQLSPPVDGRPMWEEERGFQLDRERSPSRERIRSQQRDRVRSPPRDRVRSVGRDRVRSPPRDRVRSPLREHLRSLSRDRLRSPLRDRSRSPPRERMRSPPRPLLRSPLRVRSPPERDRSPVGDRSPVRERLRSPPRERVRSPPRERVRSPPRERSPPRDRVKSPPRERIRSPPRERGRILQRELARSPVRERVRSPPRERVRSPPRERARSPPRERARSPPRERARSPPRERARSPARERIRSPPKGRVRSPPRDRLRSPRREQVRSPPQDRVTGNNSLERERSGGQERRNHDQAKGRAQDQVRNANREADRSVGRENIEKSPDRNRRRSQERNRDSFQPAPRNFGRDATRPADRDKIRKRNVDEGTGKERSRERARSPTLHSTRDKISNQNLSNSNFFIKEEPSRRFPRENNKDKIPKKDELKSDRRLATTEVKRESLNNQNISQEWEKIRDFQERRINPPAGLPFLEDSRKKSDTPRDNRSGDRGTREQKLPFLDDKNSPPSSNDPGRSWLSQGSQHTDHPHPSWTSPVKRERDRRSQGGSRDENNPHKSGSYHVPHTTINPQAAANGNDGECWQRRSYASGADAHWDKPRSDFESGKALPSKALQSPNQVVFVRGLARDVTDMDIRKDISECRLWAKDVRVVMDSGVSRGLAFITFNSVDEARRWMELREGVLNLRQNNHAPMDYSNPVSRDWECVRCHTMNFRHRTACHLCGRTKEDCLDGWEETSPYPTNALMLRGLSSSTSNAEVIKTLKCRLEGSSRLDGVQMGKDANGRSRPICFVQLTSVVDSIALHKSLSNDPVFLDGQQALVSYCQLDKLPSVMEPCGPHANLQTHTRLPASLPSNLSAGITLNLPCTTPSPNIPLVTRTPVPSAVKGLGVSTQAIRSMLEGNYSDKDIPVLAQYCAQAYAKTPQERVAFVNYYTKHYKDRLLKSVASKMMKLS